MTIRKIRDSENRENCRENIIANKFRHFKFRDIPILHHFFVTYPPADPTTRRGTLIHGRRYLSHVVVYRLATVVARPLPQDARPRRRRPPQGCGGACVGLGL